MTVEFLVKILKHLLSALLCYFENLARLRLLDTRNDDENDNYDNCDDVYDDDGDI